MQNNARKTNFLEKFVQDYHVARTFNRLVAHNIILQCMCEIIIQCVNQLHVDNVS